MLHLITSQEPCRGRGDTLKTIQATDKGTDHVWAETTALVISESRGTDLPSSPFLVLLTSDHSELEEAELVRLQAHLGKPLEDCVVERERFNFPHPWFAGSTHFYMATIYAG
ncbi:hypothetical protein ACIPJG_32130 [Streptomyces halstedii]|uniref:hypothetical protein n=1 Tax=Streptomyces halstedii TaxID=1944 RepID=UPI0037F8A6EB